MDKLKKIAMRIGLAESEGLDRYEVILKCDRDRTAFDSEAMFRSVTGSPEAIQMKVQLGCQYVNAAYGFKPVLIGPYGKAHYSPIPLPLPFNATYMVGDLNRFVTRIVNPTKAVRDIDVLVSSDGSIVTIPQYSCRLVDWNHPVQRNSEVELAKVFGYNLLVADWQLV